jgi:hypothetical protein
MKGMDLAKLEYANPVGSVENARPTGSSSDRRAGQIAEQDKTMWSESQ